MKRPARWIALSVAIVVVVLGVVLALNVGADPAQDAKQSPFLGKQVPAFNLPQLTGGAISKQSIAGKSVIINFWNTWCVPCVQELPELRAFYAEHATDPDFVMIGIVRDQQYSDDTVRAYVKKNGMDWTVAFDPGSQAALDFATRGQPETIAVSPQGVVAASKYGPMSNADLEKFLAAARNYG